MSLSRKFWIIMSIISLVFLVGLFFIVWWFTRTDPWTTTLSYFLAIVVVLAFLILIVAVVIWFMSKKRKDMVALNKNMAYRACTQCRPDFDQKVAFLGDSDKGIGSRVIGHVLGLCRIKCEPVYESVMETKDGKETEKKIMVLPEQDIYLVAYRRFKGMLGWLFEAPKIICLMDSLKHNKYVQDADFISLGSDIIYLTDSMFMPPRYGFFFLPKHYKSTYIIDEVVKNSIVRYLMEEVLTESGEIIEAGFEISDKYKKERESSRWNDMTGKNGNKGGDNK